MTRQELIALLSDRFAEGFAEATAARIGSDEAAFALLYDLATRPDASLRAAARHTLTWRAAYTVETLYFASPARLAPFAERFCRIDFEACADPGARRHFGKIMAHLLAHHDPGAETLERVAESAAAWVVDPKSRPAVRIWAMEVVKQCRGRVAWVDTAWEDLVATLSRDGRPSIAARMRGSWRQAPRITHGR